MWYQHAAIVDRSRPSIEFSTRRSTEAVLIGRHHHVDSSYVGKNATGVRKNAREALYLGQGMNCLFF